MSEFDDILLESNGLDIDAIINDQKLIDLNYEKLKRDLSEVNDNNTIQFIKISNCLLSKLEGSIFDGFHYIIDLNLSHNLLTSLPTDVFDQLFNLQTINLSYNLIIELENCVFINNKELRTINLSNNLLTEVNREAFYNLNLLRKLDINYNRIKTLSNNFVVSTSLEELNLSHNLINDVRIMAFWFLPNLIHLQINNNEITNLNEMVFRNTKKMESLNFSNNLVQRLNKKTLENLYNLKNVDFSNNLLETCGNCFKKKPMLEELNLLNNQIMKYRTKNFSLSKNIRTLKLTIYGRHILEGLKKLNLLTDLELHIPTDRIFYVKQFFLSNINMKTIQRLYMVIKKGKFNIYKDIKNLFNLEFLHIEFLEPCNDLLLFDILSHIYITPKLKHLALININKLIIFNLNNTGYHNITYLDLTGITNEFPDFLKNNFIMLEYLNLSTSKVKSISHDVMSTLPFLKYLIMNNTRITVILDNLFQYNGNLEVISFQDCQIHTIGENAFQNLENLNQIDIRGNIQLKITQSLLNGIPKSAVVYFD